MSLYPRLRLIITSVGLLAATAATARAADDVLIPGELLWPNGTPNAVGDEPADKPTLHIYLPEQDKAVGTGVVVCPGGGYGFLAVDHEGKQIAEWLNSHGIAAFVLKYRIAPRYKHPAPLMDAQRAIRTVRARAAEFGVQPDRIGIMGFSAGGHLASSAGTHFGESESSANDPVESASCRPDFLILCYPVISFVDPCMHVGSRNNLLGENASEDLIRSMSSELQVTDQTPPTFLFHTTEDAGVPPKNAILFYTALVEHGVPAELHIYEKGPHGVGLAQNDPILGTWPDRLADWLRSHQWLSAK